MKILIDFRLLRQLQMYDAGRLAGMSAGYTYNGDGARVKAVIATGSEVKTSAYVGDYFEISLGEPRQQSIPTQPDCSTSECVYFPLMMFSGPELAAGQAWMSYYSAGGQRVALRVQSNQAGLEDSVFYFLSDHLGSASLTLDEGAGKVAELRYSAWGETRYSDGSTPTQRRYTGQLEAEAGLYYYQARWYDPGLGRFIQADTIVPLQVQGTQAFDRYAYVNNNPLRYSDPSGYRACDDYYGSRCNVISPPSPNPIFNISVCGLGDSALFCGQTGADVPLSPYLSWNGQHHSFFVQGSTKADTSARLVDYIRILPTKAKIRFIGHSAGADAIILTFHSLLKMNMIGNLDIAGVVLLDPTLTANYNFEPGSNMSTYFDEMIGSEIRTFVAITIGYDSEGRIIPSINTVELLSYGNYTFERNVPLTHAELALSADIAERAERWILEGVK